MINIFTSAIIGSFWNEPLSATAVGWLLIAVGSVCGALFWFTWEKSHRVGKLAQLSELVGKENARLIVAAICILLVLFGVGVATGLIEKGAFKA